MTKAQFFLGLTLLAVGAYAWCANSKMTRMERDMMALRTHALVASKENRTETTTILTDRHIERIRAGQALSPHGEASASAPPGAELPREFDPVEMRHRADENAEHLEQAVFSEPRDPTWDAQAETEIKKLADIFPGSRIRATECRKTMCYLDVVHDDTATLANWSMRAALEPSEAFASRLSIRFAEPDGKVSTKIFLVRKGEELPAID